MALAGGTGNDRRGTVDYDGVRQEVSLAYLPETQIGDYVLVHVGFAMTRLDTAEAERIHAEGHLKALAAIATTAENLQAAIGGETYEYTDMYPPMLKAAEAEGHRAKLMFGYAVKAEAVHAELYKRALEAVQQGKDLSESGFFLCPICGHIEFGAPPEKCPICGTAKDKFTEVQ